MQHPKQLQTSNTVPGTRDTSDIPVCPPGIRTNTCATCLLLDSKCGEYSWSVIKLSKNVPYVQFKYRFMLLFFYAIQLLIFFSLNNFSSLYHLSKYFRQSQLVRFLHVLLEIRISIYCMNFIFSKEDLSPYLI